MINLKDRDLYILFILPRLCLFSVISPENYKVASFLIRGLKLPLRWGWVFLERTQILSGIQFTTHFIEIFVVKTQRFIAIFVNAKSTLQCKSKQAHAPLRSHTFGSSSFYIFPKSGLFCTAK